MTDYTPIDCGLHSRYELACMRQQSIQLAWHDEDGNSFCMPLLPLDLVTRDGAEYLLGRDAGKNEHLVRLDRITQFRFDDQDGR